jgi:hypothetical protein
MAGSSAGARVGHTACQASAWASSSGVVCKAPGGLLGHIFVIASACSLFVSSTHMFSFNSPFAFLLSLSVSSNLGIPSSGSSSVFLSGGNFVPCDHSSIIRFAKSVAIFTKWISDSFVSCKSPHGFGHASPIFMSVTGSVAIQVSNSTTQFDDIEPTCTPSFADVQEAQDDSLRIHAFCTGKARNFTLSLSKLTALVYSQTLNATCILNSLYIKSCEASFVIPAYMLQNNSVYELTLFAEAASSTSLVSNISRVTFDYLPDIQFDNLFNEINMDYLPFQRNVSVLNLRDSLISSELNVNGISIYLQQGQFTFFNNSCQISINLPDLNLYNVSTTSGGRGLFRITRFFKKIEFSFAIRPLLRPQLLSLIPSIIPFHGSDVRVKYLNISEPIFNVSCSFSHSTNLPNVSFIQESLFSISFILTIPAVQSANLSTPFVLMVSCILNNNKKSNLDLNVEMNSFRVLSLSPSKFQVTKTTPVIIAFITEMPAAPSLVTYNFRENNSSADVMLVALGTSPTTIPSPSIVSSYTAQFTLNSRGQNIVSFTVTYPQKNNTITALIGIIPYPSAYLEISVGRIVSNRNISFDVQAFFFERGRDSINFRTSMSIFQSNFSVVFECFVNPMSDDLCFLTCSVLEIPSTASFLNLSIENTFSQRKASISLEVVSLNSIRQLAVQPRSLSIFGNQLVFMIFVNLPKNTTNASFQISFSKGKFSNNILVSTKDIFIYEMNSKERLEISISSQLSRLPSVRAFLPSLIQSTELEDADNCRLIVFRVPTFVNCSGCVEGTFDSQLNVSLMSNTQNLFYITNLSFAGFSSKPTLELFTRIPVMETETSYTVSFYAKHFPPIHDPVDLYIDILDDYNFTFVPEFTIISPTAVEPLILSIKLFFSVSGTKTIRLKTRVLEQIGFDPPVAKCLLSVKPFFRIKLVRQSSDYVYANGGPRTIHFTLKDARESDVMMCNVFIISDFPHIKALFSYSCSLEQNQCILTAVIPSLTLESSKITANLAFPTGDINAEIVVLKYPNFPSVLRCNNAMSVLSSGNNADVIVEFTDFPAIANFSDVVVFMDGLIVPVLAENIRSSFLSTQVSFPAPKITFDAKVTFKVIDAFVFERGSLCNRSCPGIVSINYTNSRAAHLQYQSRSTCIVAEPCDIDIYVTNIFALNVVAFRIVSNRSNYSATLGNFQEFLMGPGLSSMSVIKTTVISTVYTALDFVVSAEFQQFTFAVSFHDAKTPYCVQVYPSLVPTYGGGSVTIHLQNVISDISMESCRVFWTTQLSSNCRFEQLISNGSYAVSTLVPLLVREAATYTLEIHTSNHTIKCIAVKSFTPDTTIHVSPSSAFSSGGQFVVKLQNFPLSTTISSIIPVLIVTNTFLNVVSVETFVKNDLLSGQMILAFSGVNPGPQSLKIMHSFIAYFSVTANIDILDSTKPTILKISPSEGHINQITFLDLQVTGNLPSNQILARGILFGVSGQIFVLPWSVTSVFSSDFIHTVTIRSSGSPEIGKCIVQLQLSNGFTMNSSNLDFIDAKSPRIQSVRKCQSSFNNYCKKSLFLTCFFR